MKILYPTLLVFALLACSPGSKETIEHDSTTALVDSTIVNIEKVAEGESEPVIEEDADISYNSNDIDTKYDELKQKLDTESEQYYVVHISYDQYEASSTVKWLFDKEFSPCYYQNDWASEGSEGSTEYIIQDDKVICALDVEETETKKWCKSTGGIKSLTDDESGASSERLDNNYGNSCNDDFIAKLDALKSIIKEGKRTQEDETTYTFRMENTEDVGFEVTESVEVTIPKKLYKVLL